MVNRRQALRTVFGFVTSLFVKLPQPKERGVRLVTVKPYPSIEWYAYETPGAAFIHRRLVNVDF